MHVPSNTPVSYKGKTWKAVGSLSLLAAAASEGQDAVPLFTAHKMLLPAIVASLMRINNEESIDELMEGYGYNIFQRLHRFFFPEAARNRFVSAVLSAHIEANWFVADDGHHVMLVHGDDPNSDAVLMALGVGCDCNSHEQ